ncbi:hypothetical protein HIM_05395 [Hirsutella minnesotensis 3608]|uniref:Autophagy-related protein n=1 Tax=Hirsutella minnesotensis 3608 TaxID=1043627 RepID=A0A0F7ZKF8_9HYPO|nr:hypothetical protein HIM_05395 [Hirsutella minnesotensis 3608]
MSPPSEPATGSLRELIGDGDTKMGGGQDGNVLCETTGLDAPDAPDAPTTTPGERRAWYLYYIGANGLALFNFGPTALQNLLELAAARESGLLDFLGRRRDVNSIVLLANGISFAIQAALMLVIGAYADFGTGRRWEARAAHRSGDLKLADLDRRDELERSRLSNVSFWLQSVCEVAMLGVIVGIMFALAARPGGVSNSWSLSVLIAFATACWLVLSMPWFALEKTRPGMQIPPGQTILTAGLWQLREALTHMWQLKQSIVYLVGYFLLGDSLNTTVTVIATLQNQVVNYQSLTLTYLLMVGIAAQAVGIGLFWLVQQRLKVSAKAMFNVITVAIVALDGWGMVGNWTNRFGFHNAWEVWAYQVFYGLLVCPWYSYSQIIISSVTPRGHEFLFFSVFNIAGKASSFIGPFVSSAIIDASAGGHNNSAPFYFLFGLSFASALGLWAFLDLERSAREQEAFLADERARMRPTSETRG